MFPSYFRQFFFFSFFLCLFPRFPFFSELFVRKLIELERSLFQIFSFVLVRIFERFVE